MITSYTPGIIAGKHVYVGPLLSNPFYNYNAGVIPTSVPPGQTIVPAVPAPAAPLTYRLTVETGAAYDSSTPGPFSIGFSTPSATTSAGHAAWSFDLTVAQPEGLAGYRPADYPEAVNGSEYHTNLLTIKSYVPNPVWYQRMVPYGPGLVYGMSGTWALAWCYDYMEPVVRWDGTAIGPQWAPLNLYGDDFGWVTAPGIFSGGPYWNGATSIPVDIPYNIPLVSQVDNDTWTLAFPSPFRGSRPDRLADPTYSPGFPLTYAYDWGDGTTGSFTLASMMTALPAPEVHTYAAPGNYVVRVTLTDTFGRRSVYWNKATVTATTAHFWQRFDFLSGVHWGAYPGTGGIRLARGRRIQNQALSTGSDSLLSNRYNDPWCSLLRRGSTLYALVSANGSLYLQALRDEGRNPPLNIATNHTLAVARYAGYGAAIGSDTGEIAVLSETTDAYGVGLGALQRLLLRRGANATWTSAASAMTNPPPRAGFVGLCRRKSTHFAVAAGTLDARSAPGTVAGLTDVTAIAAGRSHSLALKSDGTVWAWGSNEYGQLGIGSTVDSAVPVQVGGLSGITAIACGWQHSLAVDGSGNVWAWGLNSCGQLGHAITGDPQGRFDTAYSTAPSQVAGISGVTAVAGGWQHSLALKSDGTVWAWGSNGYGQLGHPRTIDIDPFTEPTGSFGDTNLEPLGGPYNTTPLAVTGMSGVISIAAGHRHSVAVKSDNTLWSWGQNYNGQANGPGSEVSHVPWQVIGYTNATAAAEGWDHTLVLRTDGTMQASGSNRCGQIGTALNIFVGGAPYPTSYQPGTAVKITNVTAIAAGGGIYPLNEWDIGHSLAVKNDGTAWQWGYNGVGDIFGINTRHQDYLPAQVAGITGATAVAAGEVHSLVLLNDGTVRSWGDNSHGQLGGGGSLRVFTSTDNCLSWTEEPTATTHALLAYAVTTGADENSLVVLAEAMDSTGAGTGTYYRILLRRGADATWSQQVSAMTGAPPRTGCGGLERSGSTYFATVNNGTTLRVFVSTDECLSWSEKI